jgi:hypothetical protein
MLKPRCVRRGQYKLVQIPYLRREELYDLAADPREQNNLLASSNQAVRALADELRAGLEAWAESLAPLPSHFDGNDAEAREKLEALGYAGGD